MRCTTGSFLRCTASAIHVERRVWRWSKAAAHGGGGGRSIIKQGTDIALIRSISIVKSREGNGNFSLEKEVLRKGRDEWRTMRLRGLSVDRSWREVGKRRSEGGQEPMARAGLRRGWSCMAAPPTTTTTTTNALHLRQTSISPFLS